MSLTRKAILAIDMSKNDAPLSMKSVRQMGFLNHAEVHLVFAFQTTSLNLGFGDSTYIYPVVADRSAIQQSAEAALLELARECFGPDFQGKLIARCLFGDEPKRLLCDYASATRADLVVMWAREKRGFFESSFSNYVTKHTGANVLVIKQV